MDTETYLKSERFDPLCDLFLKSTGIMKEDKYIKWTILLFLLALPFYVANVFAEAPEKPNVIFIYTDDLGYGDLSCYGGTEILTPHIDRLATNGLRFTNAHATSATCTPSRYALLTGQYPWRRQGTGIARGNAGAIIAPDCFTIASMFQKAGYKTGAFGKWHLGLGGPNGPDWNGSIKPGPREIGFDYNFILPATGDRTPCVYVENDRIANLDPNDPIEVSYDKKVGNEPTGKENPEMLRMQLTHGHDQTIVNGISRIGYMSGGKSARWDDETIADTLAGKAIDFIKANQNGPFFIYFATHDVHVPRVAHPRFAGKSGHGARGDVILQLDDTVAQLVKTLEELKLLDNTMIVFSSDNGPIVDDGYEDGSMSNIGNHKPAGPLRGSKYSKFEAGTRIPFIVHWPKRVRPDVSDALVSQIDLFASLASLVGQKIPDAAPDSVDSLSTIIGDAKKDRDYVIEHGNWLAILSEGWKYIPARDGAPTINPPKMGGNIPVETGNLPEPQLYNMETDLVERNNVAAEHPEIVKKLDDLLTAIK